MRSFDLTPLFQHSVGFDRLARMMDTMANEQAPSYPPYNIERTGDDAYRIVMAVAGFGEKDLDVHVENNTLTIAGRIEKTEGEEERKYLHRGIAERAFQRQFRLADHIKVTGAELTNGLLHVDLVRELPEAMKPRTITVEAKAA